MSTSKFDMLPCPFCGGAARTYFKRISNVRSGFFAECLTPGCGVRHGNPHGSVEAAIAAWNRRAPAAATPPPPDAAHGPMTEAPEVGTPCWFKTCLTVDRMPWMGTLTQVNMLGAGQLFRTPDDALAALQAEKGGDRA